MDDEIAGQREELLAYVGRFHQDDSQAEGMEQHPEVCREWLDGLFALHTELALLEDTFLLKRTTRSFTVEITKGSATNLEKQ